VEHPPEFELMINLTATMAPGFEVPAACWSAPKILFAAVWHLCDMPSLAMNVGFQGGEADVTRTSQNFRE
jgi:hypothetical protein